MVTRSPSTLGLRSCGGTGSLCITCISVSMAVSARNGGRAEFAHPAGRLFGGHVAGRAQDRTGASLARIAAQSLGQPEVGHVRLVVGVDQNIGRLQIAMQDAVAVRVMNGPGDLVHITG